MAARKRTNIADDTCVIPDIVADGVVQEVGVALEEVRGEISEALDAFLDDEGAQRGLSASLARRAEETYAASEAFAKTINGKGDKGRDALYGFMRHWASAHVRETFGAAAFDALPEGFAVGREPPPRAAPGPR
jgi:hypothetical protein